MIRNMESQIKNYAVMSQFGNGGDNNTVTLFPVDYENIPNIANSSQIDGVVRFFPDGSIYRIQVGKNIYSDHRQIEEMARILGLHKESRANLNISKKRFDFNKGVFVG